MTGFIVVDAEGEFLAWASDPEVAVKRMRTVDDGEFVYRCVDDELIASKRRQSIAVPLHDHPGRALPFLPDYFG